jgi:hypothetical protein
MATLKPGPQTLKPKADVWFCYTTEMMANKQRGQYANLGGRLIPLGRPTLSSIGFQNEFLSHTLGRNQLTRIFGQRASKHISEIDETGVSECIDVYIVRMGYKQTL